MLQAKVSGGAAIHSIKQGLNVEEFGVHTHEDIGTSRPALKMLKHCKAL